MTHRLLGLSGTTETILLGSGSVSANSEADNDPGTAENSSASAKAVQSAALLQAGSSPRLARSPTRLWRQRHHYQHRCSFIDSGLCEPRRRRPRPTDCPARADRPTRAGPRHLQLGLAAGMLVARNNDIGECGSTPSAYPDESFITRVTASGGSSCGSTSGDGCIHAGAQEAYGTVTFGGPALAIRHRHTLRPLVGGRASSPSATTPLRRAPRAESARPTRLPACRSPGLRRQRSATGTEAGTRTLTLSNWGTSPPTITIPTVSVKDSSDRSPEQSP